VSAESPNIKLSKDATPRAFIRLADANGTIVQYDLPDEATQQAGWYTKDAWKIARHARGYELIDASCCGGPPAPIDDTTESAEAPETAKE
jgi:hypothetical protein